jgi:AcrR family transcriptional regulator
VATAVAAGRPRFRRLPPAERRAQIITTARRLFSERTYDAVSTAEVAEAAGINRGLLHHYFGTKRHLYIEVVRDMVRVPPPLPPAEVEGRPVEEMWGQFLDGWLTMVSRNKGTWLAAIGAEGFGRDPELERILDDAREAMADRIIDVLGAEAGPAPVPELRAAVRGWIGLADATTWEWLVRRRLSREQVRVLLLEAAIAMRGIVPHVVRAR